MQQAAPYLKFFFTYESDLPEGIGFSHFGTAHLVWLGLLFVCGLLFYRRFSHWNKKKQQRALRWLGIIQVLLEGMRLYVLWHIHRLSVYELPLHLCGMAGFLCLLHAYTEWDWLSQVLYALCLPGTLAALLFPNWIKYPAFHFITIQSFLLHALIVLYVACALACGRIQPNFRHFWKPLVFLAVVLPPVYLFDLHFAANYFFLCVPEAGTPLQWFADRMGNPGYLLGYAGLTLAIMLLMYLPAAGRHKKHNRA
ncbi:MAG: YwaF family protein [Oscillospiraceae bacterium]|jgi:hypothetical integral membrane protein (TIGR02206 family)|nr:YwaF family protein [Oscillospiraceae bacterium]